MSAERKSTFEVALLWERVSLHEPGTILILCPRQESDAFSVHYVGSRNACNMQGIQRDACRIRVGRRAAVLEVEKRAHQLPEVECEEHRERRQRGQE